MDFSSLAGLGDIAGALINKRATKDASELNAQTQREFAQQGVRWKVADAKAAGIHPLYALGASTASFSPSYVGDQSVGNAISRSGQDISRSIEATRTAEERKQAGMDQLVQQLTSRDRELDTQRRVLENELLAARIAQLRAAPNPPMAGGSGLTGGAPVVLSTGERVRAVKGSAPVMGAVKVEPSSITSHAVGDASREAGITPGMKRFSVGGVPIDLPGQQLAESLESIPMGGAAVMLLDQGRKFKRALAGGEEPRTPLPPGYKWVWSISSQSWVPEKPAPWNIGGRGQARTRR